MGDAALGSLDKDGTLTAIGGTPITVTGTYTIGNYYTVTLTSTKGGSFVSAPAS